MTQAELEGDATAAEAGLLARLRAGDEAAFEGLVARHYATMLAVAMTYVKGRATAEEVVQETWLGVIQGLDRFEGRSSLKTWILSILVHKAKSRGVREARSVPFASLGPDEPAVDPGAVPGPRRVLPGALARVPARLERVGRLGGAGPRDAAGGDGRDRRAPARPADGDPDARRRGLLA